MGFALQIATADNAVVVAKIADVINKAVIFVSPCNFLCCTPTYTLSKRACRRACVILPSYIHLYIACGFVPLTLYKCAHF